MAKQKQINLVDENKLQQYFSSYYKRNGATLSMNIST